MYFILGAQNLVGILIHPSRMSSLKSHTVDYLLVHSLIMHKFHIA